MPLVNTGLVCRYYFDEAASGTTPSQVNDHSGNSYHLTEINYGSGNLAYTEDTGQRGLESAAITGTQRARRSIDDTSDALRNAMAGVQKATIEVVLDIAEGNASGSRIFGINNRAGANGELCLKASAATQLFLAWNDTNHTSENINPGSGRHVIHFVVDTTQATQADRIKCSIDGGAFEPISNGIAQNDTLTLGSNLDLICFNRESSGNFDRSFTGTLYYAAMYAHAFSESDVDTNYDILTLDDDTPAGGGGGELFTREVDDQLDLGDGFLKRLAANRDDSFAAGDLLTKTLSASRGEDIVINDEVLTSRLVSVMVSELVEIADDFVKKLATVQAEETAVADALVKTISAWRTEQVELEDALSVLKFATLIITDLIDVLDDYSKTISKLEGEELSAQDAIVKTLISQIADGTIEFADLAAAARIKTLNLEDQIELSEEQLKSLFFLMDELIEARDGLEKHITAFLNEQAAVSDDLTNTYLAAGAVAAGLAAYLESRIASIVSVAQRIDNRDLTGRVTRTSDPSNGRPGNKGLVR